MDYATQLESQLKFKTEVGLFFLNESNGFAAYAKNVPFLDIVSEPALTALTKKAQIVIYPKKDTIVVEGDEADAFYVILSGKVRLFVSDEKGKEVTLNFQDPGTYFGEIALLAKERISVSVIALEKTVCAVISKNEFIIWLINYPDVTFILLGVLSEKIKQLTDKVKQMTLLDTYGRMVAILEGLAVDEGSFKVIYNMPSQRTLASMVGASRETVNKIMCELIQGGYVDINNKNLFIKQKLPFIR
ncbi:MAG: Crp/Fnr family transcriptional regulator [Methylococcaceae bacterium]|nr:Crp/Fnr family transcriptional regulator [Methylococcaceae bacterium]